MFNQDSSLSRSIVTKPEQIEIRLFPQIGNFGDVRGPWVFGGARNRRGTVLAGRLFDAVLCAGGAHADVTTVRHRTPARDGPHRRAEIGAQFPRHLPQSVGADRLSRHHRLVQRVERARSHAGHSHETGLKSKAIAQPTCVN